MTNRNYKAQKESSLLLMAASQMSGQGEQQQQPANHSSDNEETARCLTPSLTLEQSYHARPASALSPNLTYTYLPDLR